MAICQKWCKIGGKLVLITNRKSYISFRLVPKSVTLNDLERRNGRYFALFQRIWVASGVHCVKVHVRYLISWWVLVISNSNKKAASADRTLKWPYFHIAAHWYQSEPCCVSFSTEISSKCKIYVYLHDSAYPSCFVQHFRLLSQDLLRLLAFQLYWSRCKMNG